MANTACKQKHFLYVIFQFLRYDTLSKYFVLSCVLIFAVLIFSVEPLPQSALSAFLFPMQWNNALFLITLGASLCSSSYFARDMTTKFYLFEVVRMGKIKYIIARFISSAISTGLVMLLASSLFAVVCIFANNEIITATEIENQADFGAFEEFVYSGQIGYFYLSVLYVQFLFGSFVGCLGLVGTAFVRSKYIAFAFPMIILFILSQFSLYLAIPIWLNPLVFAKCLYEIGSAEMTLIVYSAVFLCLNVCLMGVFICKAKRVIDNG